MSVSEHFSVNGKTTLFRTDVHWGPGPRARREDAAEGRRFPCHMNTILFLFFLEQGVVNLLKW